MSRLTPLDEEAIRRDYEGGLTCAEVGAKHGVDAMTIHRRLRRIGAAIRTKGPRRPLRPKADVGAMVEDYNAGMTLRQVAAKHGQTNYTVASLLRERGVAIRPVAYYHTRHDVDAAAMVEEYLSGLSMDEVAAKHGVGRRVVVNRLKERNVPRRSGLGRVKKSR